MTAKPRPSRTSRARPDNLVLLIDTYDTEAGARKVVALGPKLKEIGATLRAVRIDSGDLIGMAKKVRRILDDGAMKHVTIFVSGGINEDVLATMHKSGAPVDGFGIGANLDTSQDAPTLDCAYKLQEYAGKPRRKLSEGKETWPGRKQVWRDFAADGTMRGDILSLENDSQTGRPLIAQVMKQGKRAAPAPKLNAVREHAALELKRLPEPLRRLGTGRPYSVTISKALRAVAAQASRTTTS